jgi:predicted permease
VTLLPALRTLISRVVASFTRRRDDVALSDEIQVHLDQLAAEYARSGMSPDQARAAARREFGGVDQIKETYRDRQRLPVVETTLQDLRYAVRTFRRSPGFVAVVVVSLSLGIGLNSAIFSVLNTLILRSLPVRNPQELFVALPQVPTTALGGLAGIRFSYPVFEQLRRVVPAPGTLAAMTRISRMYGRTDGEQESRLTPVQLVSGEYFSLFGISAERGRLFAPEDNQNIGGHAVAVISHGFWLRRFGGGPDVVGRGLTLNGVHFTIVGVTEPGFSGVWLEAPADVWIPLMMQAEVHYAQNFSDSDADADKPWIPQEGIRWLDIVGREGRPGATIAALDTAYRQTIAREAEHIGDSTYRDRFVQQRLMLQPFGQGFSNLRTRFAPPLIALLAMAALILLIACANTINLLLARAAAREREIAIRLSIGASRSRLIRQLLTESFVLVTMATAIGLVFAGWAGDLLVRQALGSTGSAPFSVDVNGRVLAFTIAASFATVLLFGLVPAFRATSVSLGTTLKLSAARGSSARPKLQKFLVAAQVALSLVLLVGAGLFARSLQNYAKVPLGFSQEHVLTVLINPHIAGYSSTRLSQLYRSLIDRVKTVPGVSSASLAMCGLASGCQTTSDIVVDGYQARAGEDLHIQENRVSPGYFATTGMRIVEGRAFDDHDTELAPKVAIVNRALVQRFFPDQRALGRRFGYDKPDTEIVGVVEDARVNRVQQPAVPMAFYPIAQDIVDAGVLDVRAAGDPRSMITEVRRAVTDVDSNLPIDRVTILSEQVASGLNQERLVAGLTSIFGLLALGLACFGLFGVMSYAVAGRTTEFGIRMALGAQQSGVLAAVFRESLMVVACGLAAGIPAVLASSRLLGDLLFGVDPTDPTTVSFAAMLLVGVAALASVVPAWRASRVDPMVALRCE